MKTFQTSPGASSASARPASRDGPVRGGWRPAAVVTEGPASLEEAAPVLRDTPGPGARRSGVWGRSARRLRTVWDRVSALPTPASTEEPARTTSPTSTAPAQWGTRATAARTISPSATLSPVSTMEPAQSSPAATPAPASRATRAPTVSWTRTSARSLPAGRAPVSTRSVSPLSLTSFTPVESLRRSRPWL